MNERDQLNELNQRPDSQHAKALLLKAGQKPEAGGLYLLQLCRWGLRQPDVQVSEAVKLEQVLGNLAAQNPHRALGFLLNANPGAEPWEEDQISHDLLKEKDPLEAAESLLQVLQQHASCQIPYWDKT